MDANNNNVEAASGGPQQRMDANNNVEAGAVIGKVLMGFVLVAMFPLTLQLAVGVAIFLVLWLLLTAVFRLLDWATGHRISGTARWAKVATVDHIEYAFGPKIWEMPARLRAARGGDSPAG